MSIINAIRVVICKFIAIFFDIRENCGYNLDNEIRYQFFRTQSLTNTQTTEEPKTKYDNESQYHILKLYS